MRKLNYLNYVVIAGLSVAIASCGSKGGEPTPDVGTDPAITLDCDYFEKNPNAVLKDNPDAPVDYIINCRMNIEDNVTIEPGVTIAFGSSAGFYIEETGSLQAAGMHDKKITFTGTDKIKGAWGTLYFESNNSKNELSNTIIEYGGGSSYSGNGTHGAVTIYKDARLKFTNNIIQNNAKYGLVDSSYKCNF